MNVLKKLYGGDSGEWGTSLHSFKAEEFEIIDTLSKDYDIKMLCSLMGVSRAGYYKWRDRGRPALDDKRRQVIEMVTEVHAEHPSPGYRWVCAYIRINYGVTFKYPNLIFTT